MVRFVTSHVQLVILPILCAISLSTIPQVQSAQSSASCTFASQFNAGQLFTDPATQQRFAQTVAQWEGQFAQPNPCAGDENIGLHAATGMTLDGHRLSIETGLPLPGGAHNFTAASKESLHLALIAQALSGNIVAATFLSPDDPNQAPFIALNQLATKVNTLDAFDLAFPGFGGFLPWVDVNDWGLSPTPDFNSSVPSLDNGQMFWGAYAVAYVLKQNFSEVPHKPMENSTISIYSNWNTTLAQRWENVVQRMIDNSLIIFYDAWTNTSTGQFRTVSFVTDRTKPIDPTVDPWISAQNYNSAPGCDQCYLDDPYEGELFTNMAYLFGDWSWTGASPDSVWMVKRAKLQSVQFDFPSANQSITVERGWWFSGHEKWKFSFMPYTLSEWSRRVFLNGEKARTWNSVMLELPSGYASVSGTANEDGEDTGYKSDCGIPSIAFQSVSNVDIVTPYSFAALFLASPSHGYVWYQNYLLAARGQTCFGSLEGFNRTGWNFSPVVTWDTKITTLVAMAGGLGEIISDALEATIIDRTQHRTVSKDLTTNLDLFVSIIDREWSRVFSDMIGEDSEFQLPNTPFPPSPFENFPSCTSQATNCQCVHESTSGAAATEEEIRKELEETNLGQSTADASRTRNEPISTQ